MTQRQMTTLQRGMVGEDYYRVVERDIRIVELTSPIILPEPQGRESKCDPNR